MEPETAGRLRKTRLTLFPVNQVGRHNQEWLAQKVGTLGEPARGSCGGSGNPDVDEKGRGRDETLDQMAGGHRPGRCLCPGRGLRWWWRSRTLMVRPRQTRHRKAKAYRPLRRPQAAPAGGTRGGSRGCRRESQRQGIRRGRGRGPRPGSSPRGWQRTRRQVGRWLGDGRDAGHGDRQSARSRGP